eukprot:CAMPEP_0206019744 /NCGR_PEP_ID=MMETSP1464-20131121/29677_1 /ASSEMBLY_ACC=CAM_ASM_001124 /TAXON_ID=119497 /ORGANISM="Exanthemachrysis gayraliae, Strain RCC1523" /LENGTH=139 /DNA_ID=CAMNT_0053393653 /DNA_START=151 /DNA_END=566 /DNA_ORIENTATION=-
MAPLWAVASAASAASCSKAVAGFGEAIVFHVLLHACSLATPGGPWYTVKEAVSIQVPVSLATNVAYTAVGFRQLDTWLCVRAAPPTAAGLLAGVHLLIAVDPAVASRAIGVVFLVYSLWCIGRDARSALGPVPLARRAP